jgi:hypothetical protein
MPLEDFTTYTEVDPNNRFTVTATKVDVVGLERNEDAYVYADKGVDHFDGDFEILFETFANSGASAFMAHAMMSNFIDDYEGHRAANESFLAVDRDGAEDIILVERDGAGQFPDVSSRTVGPWYCIFERDESVGSFGTMYCFIYSDSDRLTLVDTLSIALHTSKKDFRYYYVANSVNDGNVLPFTGYSQNHDLQEISISKVGGLVNKGLINSGLIGGRLCG